MSDFRARMANARNVDMPVDNTFVTREEAMNSLVMMSARVEALSPVVSLSRWIWKLTVA